MLALMRQQCDRSMTELTLMAAWTMKRRVAELNGELPLAATMFRKGEVVVGATCVTSYC